MLDTYKILKKLQKGGGDVHLQSPDSYVRLAKSYIISLWLLIRTYQSLGSHFGQETTIVWTMKSFQSYVEDWRLVLSNALLLLQVFSTNLAIQPMDTFKRILP